MLNLARCIVLQYAKNSSYLLAYPYLASESLGAYRTGVCDKPHALAARLSVLSFGVVVSSSAPCMELQLLNKEFKLYFHVKNENSGSQRSQRFSSTFSIVKHSIV